MPCRSTQPLARAGLAISIPSVDNGGNSPPEREILPCPPPPSPR